ncbi:glycosyltransferase [Lacticaseibacillus baoqingensis]|uniref:Glycosyltransferase n=1 Tax=Lacticaseibacillus baoqingensis TaxID=2486013 RepID=A0ABW4EA88_9LACO|nr:glycosyltransferase [Lacticaseibacillus baoqingensis]
MEITYRKRANGVVASSYRLQLSDGRQWHLLNQEQAYTVFLDCLNRDDGEGGTFISDRSNHTNRPMLNMTTKARKLEHFHNIHFADYHDPMHSPLTYPSIAESDNLSRTDMVITPTRAQAQDMAQRLRTQVPIVAIPVGSVTPAQLAQPHIPMDQRQRGQILIVARMYYEKHLDDALWAFKRAHDQLPWLTLTIYGYGDGTTDHRDEKLLHKIVDEQHLNDCVTFAGYTNDIGKVYDQSQLLLLSSRYEGFVLAILEAASHGVPTVSYDTHYGPAELIQPGQSGELLPYGDVNGLGDAIIKTFSTQGRLTALSAGAYARAADFSQERVWARWQETVIAPAGK